LSYSETYIKVKGNWTYLYRAVDKYWRTVDFLLSERRDVTAAKRFFRRAMRHNGRPRVITLDGYAVSHRAVRVEQDHRRVQQRVLPMLGFKRFDTATITIGGIELAEKIKKAQFKIGKR